VALSKKGIYVGYAGTRIGSSETYSLAGGHGVVLGKLFERPNNRPSTSAPHALGESRSREILASRGRQLVDQYWGRYVAFLNEGDSGTSWVLRDPSAGLPCLTVRFGGVRLFFSAMRDIEHLDLGSFDVNWEYLAAWVCMMKGPTQATALWQVSQVLGGECLEIHDDQSISTWFWNPLEVAKKDIIDDPTQAARSLHDCVVDAVGAWASCYSGITLALSGGLDSSIVYAALRDSPGKAKLTCFHHYPLGSDLDERNFARLVAQSGGSELIERPRPSTVSLEPLLGVEASHSPSDYLYYLEHSRLDAQFAAEHNATAVFSGWGGDQVFYQCPAFLAAGDYLHHKGLRPELLRIALESAQMDRVSVWHVLKAAFAEHIHKRRWSPHGELAGYMTLIRREVLDEVYGSGSYLHPALRGPDGTPSGKLLHALQVVAPLEFYDPLGREDDPEQVAPLYSQPVLELCLRVPVHLLTIGGWDRAIARRAFYSHLPREVANRRNKGGIEGHIWTVLENNRRFIRELLLGGSLVDQGIVDRKRLTRALSGKPSKLQQSTVELLHFIAAEAWLRRRRNQGWRVAA
jgi:asparagine synthase (glutamine-hydrolysing)